jgi:hypothetical protein
LSKHERVIEALRIAATTPRYNTLTICIRGALRGWRDGQVQHMLSRNREVEMMRAMLAKELVLA